MSRCYLRKTVGDSWNRLAEQLLIHGKLTCVLYHCWLLITNGYRVGYGKDFMDEYFIPLRKDVLKIEVGYFANS